jgi:hypothetical protein
MRQYSPSSWQCFVAVVLIVGGATADAANTTLPANATLLSNSSSLSPASNASTGAGGSNNTGAVGVNFVGVNWGVLSSEPLPGNVTVRILQVSIPLGSTTNGKRDCPYTWMPALGAGADSFWGIPPICKARQKVLAGLSQFKVMATFTGSVRQGVWALP